MARVTIEPTTVSLQGVELATEAADDTDGMQFINDGKQLLFVDNGGGSPITVTVNLATDKYGRTGKTEVTVPDGEQRFIGPFPVEPYNEGNLVTVDFSDDTSVTVGVLSLPY